MNAAIYSSEKANESAAVSQMDRAQHLNFARVFASVRRRSRGEEVLFAA